MRETLEDLYYGNITPYVRQIRSGTSLMKAMEQSQECEEQLAKLLDGEAHSLLLRLINAENEIGSTLALENFILGFRLGARLILEALDEDDGCLVELLRRNDRREEQGLPRINCPSNAVTTAAVTTLGWDGSTARGASPSRSTESWATGCAA